MWRDLAIQHEEMLLEMVIMFQHFMPPVPFHTFCNFVNILYPDPNLEFDCSFITFLWTIFGLYNTFEFWVYCLLFKWNFICLKAFPMLCLERCNHYSNHIELTYDVQMVMITVWTTLRYPIWTGTFLFGRTHFYSNVNILSKIVFKPWHKLFKPFMVSIFKWISYIFRHTCKQV